MPDEAELSRRLRAVERSLTDGEHTVTELQDSGVLVDRIESLEKQLADAEGRITELEAATQALRGYVGNVRSVNEDVERRADAALAAVEQLESRSETDRRTTRTSHVDQSKMAIRGPVQPDTKTERTPDRVRDRSRRESGSSENETNESIIHRIRDVF